MARKYSIETIFSAVDKMSLPINNIEKRLGRFGRRAKHVMGGVAKASGKIALSLGGIAKKTAKWGTGLSAVGGVAVTLMNKASVEAETLAKSVGLSIETLEGLTAAIKPAGFNFENIIDLVEEMNNKIGESAGLAEITPVKESLQILGLEFKALSKLKPEEQFRAIADAALEMKDAQKAASAVDILMGGEANKIIGVLRERKQTIGQILKAQNEMNFRTEESRKGARQFVSSLSRLEVQMGSLASMISGRVGAAVSGALDRISEAIGKNKGNIEKFVGDTMEALGNYSDKFIEWTKTISSREIIRGMKGLASEINVIAEGIVAMLTPLKMLFKLGQNIRTEAIDPYRSTMDKFMASVDNVLGTEMFFKRPEGAERKQVTNSVRSAMRDKEMASRTEVVVRPAPGASVQMTGNASGVRLADSTGR